MYKNNKIIMNFIRSLLTYFHKKYISYSNSSIENESILLLNFGTLTRKC